MASGPKELYVVEGAMHIDLYDAPVDEKSKISREDITMIENLEAEARGALNNVMALQKMPSEAKWFLNCLYRAFSPRLLVREKPEIILLGEDIPGSRDGPDSSRG